MAVLVFVILFKLADALAFSLSTNFLLGLGFSLKQLATIRNLFGFIATLLGGFTGGFIAQLSAGAEPLDRRHLAIGDDSRLRVQAVIGMSATMLTATTCIEYFSDAVGTTIFVAYISVQCKNPLYTATQFPHSDGVAGLGRNVFALITGYVEHVTGWVGFFIICACAGLPALGMLAWLQNQRHFDGLTPARHSF